MKTNRMNDSQPRTDRRASWLSLGFEDLVHSISRRGGANRPFDVLIVGSGYGGAVAAAELAGATNDKHEPIEVCVLERGQEYLPGMFPAAADELAGHVRFSNAKSSRPAGKLDGLFDIRMGSDVTAVVANGLGGGSLINAGAMLEPDDSVLSQGFGGDLTALLKEARDMLGAKRFPGHGLLKTQALENLAKDAKHAKFEPVHVTIGTQDGEATSANVELAKCVDCGDCATGCNVGAKNSLDINLLAKAAHRGASIFTGASVLRIERGPQDQGWIVHTVATDRSLRTRQGNPVAIHARKLILAAGTFGSTEILLRSRGDKLRFSPHLGRHFSTNGDMIAVIYGQKDEANAVAREEDKLAKRNVGPTITSMIDMRKSPEHPFAIQEIAIPAALRRMFEEAFTTAHVLHALRLPDTSTHGREAKDPCAVDWQAIKRSSVLAIMGDDEALGALELVGGKGPEDGDGAVTVRWPELRFGERNKPNHSLFDRQVAAVKELVGTSKVGGTVLPNPLWRLLPEKLSFLVDEARGPALTVHPLGGCRMAASALEGVVSFDGEVFDAAAELPTDTFGDLVVLDGSIVPRSLGINPALTIAALALRASRNLRASWNLTAAGDEQLPARKRPHFRIAPEVSAKPASGFAVVERLCGEVAITMPGEAKARKKVVELTIHYEATALADDTGAMSRTFKVDCRDGKSTLRIFDPRKYRIAIEADPDEYKRAFGNNPHHDPAVRLKAAAESVAPLEGTLRCFHREPSTVKQRKWRALYRWFWHRGLRDIVHFAWQTWRERGKKKGSANSLRERVDGVLKLATRAGEIRLFEYELRATPEGKPWFDIKGRKRLSYSLPTNLWEQLETLELTHFGERATRGKLAIDLNYFTTEKTPLARIDNQHNLVSSLVDLGAFGAYLFRVLVTLHLWTFRRPETPRPREPQRLPGVIKRHWWRDPFGMPPPRPQIFQIPVATLPDGKPVLVRLTRYARFDTRKVPVLLIHGYSASGTTFAHTAIRPSLAEALWRAKRDVWIVDMRTSAGLPTAVEPWSFEDAALVDIPAAIEFILRESGHRKLDVVAHCMGAAMFSMAVLKAPQLGDPWFELRRELPGKIARAVLSQVGPLVKFTPINVLRAYILRYVRQYLGVSLFDFRVKDSPSLPDQILDRLLSSLRYPAEELAIESPWWAPWRRNEFVGTRHRIDALYGRAFSLANLSREVLANIDDFFGPLNLESVSQGMHMAQQRVITDRNGRNVFLNRVSRDERWTFPTLTVHGKDNGLVDVATKERIDRYFNRNDATQEKLVPRRIRQRVYPDLGHQDSLIGTKSAQLFEDVIRFLNGSDARLPARAPMEEWLVAPPWIGPHRGIPDPAKAGIPIAAAANRKFGDAEFVVCVPVSRNADSFVPAPVGPAARTTYVFHAKCDKDGWVTIQVPPHLLAPEAEGLLFLLLYDQPRTMAENAGSWAALREQLVELNQKGIAVAANLTQTPLDSLEAMVTEAQAQQMVSTLDALAKSFVDLDIEQWIHQRVLDEIRKKPAKDFESAFIATPKPQVDEVPVAQIFLASCQYPSGLLDAGPAWKSYERLGAVIKESAADQDQRLLLLVGDQIYSDATAGLFDPSLVYDRYRRPHEALFSQKEVKAVLRQIPAAMMLDDHEISDNWEPAIDDARPRDSLKDGLEAYKDFQRRAGPMVLGAAADSDDSLWFTQQLGNVRLFVADTRTERRARIAARCHESRIMSRQQHRELRKWLRKLKKDPATVHAPKFIVSPAIMFPRRLATVRDALRNDRAGPRPSVAGCLRSDAWEGFPWSMHSLLQFIADEQIANVVFLSGDEHLFLDATIEIACTEPESKPVVIRSIHSSALYAPFTFANARREDFIESETYCFESPYTEIAKRRRNSARKRSYRCTVEAKSAPVRSGFTEIRVFGEGDTWRVDAWVHDANAPKKTSLTQSWSIPAGTAEDEGPNLMLEARKSDA